MMMIDLVAAIIWLGVAVLTVMSRAPVPWWIHVTMCILLAVYHIESYLR